MSDPALDRHRHVWVPAADTTSHGSTLMKCRVEGCPEIRFRVPKSTADAIRSPE